MSTTSMDQRIADRRAQVRDQRRRRRLRRTLTVVILLVVALALVLVERSSLVALAEVRVVGTERLDPQVVRDAADLPLGTSTLRLDLGAATARVAALPLVRDADIRRVDPLTVEVEVDERTPVLAARVAGGAFLVDADGVVIASGEEPGLVPVDVTASGARPTVGGTIDAVPALANAYRVHVALPGPLRAEIERYVAAGTDDLELVLVGGRRVRFGRATRIAEKARALGAVLEDLADTPVAVIDVRVPTAPVVER